MRRRVWLTVIAAGAATLIILYWQKWRYPIIVFHHPLETLAYPEQAGPGIPLFSPDNHTLAILSEPKQEQDTYDYSAIIVDVETGDEQGRFPHLGAHGYFTADGADFDSLGPRGFVQCDLKTGIEKTLVHTTGTFQALSHDFHLLLVNEDDFLTLYDTRSGKTLKRFPGKDDWAGSAISRDGKWIAISAGGGDGGVHVYSVSTGVEVAHLSTPTDQDAKVAFSRDGTRLATACDHHPVTLWETKQWTRVKELPIEDYIQIDFLYFWSDNLLVVGGSRVKQGDSNEVWNPKTARLILETPGMDLAISRDGPRVAAEGSQENTLLVSDLQSGRGLFSFDPGSRLMFYPCFSDDGTLLAECSNDDPATYLIWRVPH